MDANAGGGEPKGMMSPLNTSTCHSLLVTAAAAVAAAAAAAAAAARGESRSMRARN